MNKYKELIEELEIQSACVKYNDDCFLCAELGEEYEACRHDRELFFQAKAAIEQLVRERDAAVDCILELREDFADCVCSGSDNHSPYCANKTRDCTDKRGWCDYTHCTEFEPAAFIKWRGVEVEE